MTDTMPPDPLTPDPTAPEPIIPDDQPPPPAPQEPLVPNDPAEEPWPPIIPAEPNEPLVVPPTEPLIPNDPPNDEQRRKATRPNDATRQAEGKEASADHRADRPPTDDEERRAEEVSAEVGPETGEHFSEMIEIGAENQGEGRIA